MTPIDSTLAPRPNAPSPTVAGSAPAAPGMIGSDFETFLRMLTTQLKNQDPLNPLQATDFAVQLATFSGVEQQVRTNQLLEGILTQSTLGELAGLVGMRARAPGPLRFDGTGVALTLPPMQGADSARLVVRDALGQVVGTSDVPADGGAHVWRGLGPDGLPLGDGLYSFEVVGLVAGEIVASRPVEGYAEVVEARRDDGATVLVLDGGREIALGEVTALRGAGTN